jgi:hypothetical protein
MQRASHTNEPFNLVQRRIARDTYSSWYVRARSTIGSFITAFSLTSEPMVVVARRGELRPVTAGAVVGGVGGAVMLAVSTLVARRAGHELDLASLIGASISRGWLAGNAAFWAGLTLSILTGAVVGMLFANLTRRLRLLAPLMAFGLVLTTSTWLVIHALALPRFVPWLARALPIGPMTIGAALFGIILSLELPLRTRRLA